MSKKEKVETKEKDFSTKKREAKIYNLAIGSLPNKDKSGKVEIPFNYHALILGKAINSLVEEGKKVATREEITAKAKELDLYKKESKSSPSYIFSWWLKSLKALGYITN
jgi:hypothetical protein